MDSPILRQMFVASAPQLAAISIGGVVGFPNVILEQFKANDTTIQVDIHMASWIGSTHGLAGIPSIAMPTIMQWKGRKLSFLLCCFLIITGWILTYISKNVMTIIIAECFHGLASNSLIIVSFYTISEMIAPKYRMISMSFYAINQTFGMAVIGIIARYLHWKTVTIIMSVPIIVAFVTSCAWPESPSWLAYKGEYTKCEKAFKWLRGTDDISQKELKELLNAQRGSVKPKASARVLLKQIISRDFYVPCFHTFVILCAFYWSGIMVIFIYGPDILQRATSNSAAAKYGMISINIILYIGILTTTFLLKNFSNKTVLLFSGITSTVFLVSASIVTYLQSIGLLPSNSMLSLYCVVGFMLFMSLGMTTVAFVIPAELMPVKHRGLGGAVYVILLCLLHASSLKISPYLMLYVGLWGTFLVYAVNALVCMVIVWRCVPETKGKTLQEIEDYYNYGSFVRNPIENGVNELL
ncbi:facilitated trehalose transporter Tret1 [Manduca sexta]|uniref:facilitated trehalose transporter Tret1 n=1 Tax=Manduca sexta TaxID=7130 RepID=UPI0018907CAF|nr:facilitated trehalose transporter Tret1 [Manduca sexta]